MPSSSVEKLEYEAAIARAEAEKLEITRISCQFGKYTFVKIQADFRVYVLRFDEPWLTIESGSRAIAALMDEYVVLKEFAKT